MAGLMSHPLQFLCQLAHALTGPPQRRFRISARHRLHQSFQIPQERRILSHRPLSPATGTANPTGRVDANFAQFRHALTDDLPRHARGASDCRDATASNRRALRGCQQASGALIQNPAHGGEALRDSGEV